MYLVLFGQWLQSYSYAKSFAFAPSGLVRAAGRRVSRGETIRGHHAGRGKRIRLSVQ